MVLRLRKSNSQTKSTMISSNRENLEINSSIMMLLLRWLLLKQRQMKRQEWLDKWLSYKEINSKTIFAPKLLILISELTLRKWIWECNWKKCKRNKDSLKQQETTKLQNITTWWQEMRVNWDKTISQSRVNLKHWCYKFNLISKKKKTFLIRNTMNI